VKKIHGIIFFIVIASMQLLPQGSFLQELVKAQESRGIKVIDFQETQFENQVQNLSMQLARISSLTEISQDNIDQISMALSAFYMLFFNPEYIRYSTRPVMNDFFDQLKTWHDVLKKNNIMAPWVDASGEGLKKLLILALKEICLFGRYTKHKEEHLVTFKLRLQHILTTIMMDAYLVLWKNELIINNQEFFLGSFYSWEVQLIKAEFKDSVALTPLFNKLAASIDVESEKQEVEQYEQQLALEKQQLAKRRQQEADLLRTIITNTEQQMLAIDDVSKEMLYLNYVRALLDPAYLDLSTQERKSIDTFNNQFKKLHTTIGNKFVPILSQEGIDALKLLVAKSLETISSPLSGKTGGVSFKNHVESVLKTMLSIGANQTLIENQIKFQWIKPLYTDNQFLTSAMKKKLFDIFNNQHFQRWQAATRNVLFKVLDSDVFVKPIPIAVQMPTAEKAPIIAKPTPIPQYSTEEIVENLPMPKRMRQKNVEPEKPTSFVTQKDIINIKKVPTVKKIAPKELVILKEEIAPTPFQIIPAQPMVAPVQPIKISVPSRPQTQSANIQQIGQVLITQALVAPITTVEKNLAIVSPAQKFDVMRTTDNFLYTPIHSAASLARADVLEILLKDLTSDERYAIVTMRDKDGQTALHLAAAAKSAPTKGFKPVNAIKELLRNLTQKQQINFITMEDNDGTTAIDIAQGINKAVAINLKEIVQRK
jgi:hypothetical protein